MTKSTRVAAFTGGIEDPSARLRIRQYANDLREHNVIIDEYYPRIGSSHPPQDGASRIPWLLSQLNQRLWQLKNVRDHDVTVFQRQLISTINTFEPMIRGPRVLDVDDAIWLTSRFRSVARLARSCSAIICGNDYLAEYFSSYNQSISVIPTAVDTRTWVPAKGRKSTEQHNIGWIGTCGNQKYLYGIEDALLKVLKNSSGTYIMVVSDAPPRFSKISPSRVIYRPWREATEIYDVQDMAVGVMPLEDNAWARGKCSCKMLQYMACGLPVVASPVGTNVQVASYGGALLANSQDEWADGLLGLLRNDALSTDMGAKARSVVVQNYSTHAIAASLANVLHQCA